jgi:LmbE family N-acetylglucosaminyl deacetylase
VGQADVIVDVTDVYETKIKAILAYRSQFVREAGEVETPLNHPTYLAMIRGRDQLWGHQIGALYAEGLASPRPISLKWLVEREN